MIELLTVVVILGILTAVALPQYRKAVERSYTSEAMAIGKSIIESQNRFLTAYPGQTPSSKRDLDIILNDGTWTSNSVFKTKNFTYTLSGSGVSIERTTGEFTITMNNMEYGGKSTCSGQICDSMQGLFRE